MSRKNKSDHFWIGYSDLMTTLFFVMLVLFVLTVVHLTFEKNRIQTSLEQFQKITKLEEQFDQLEKDKDFTYLEECKKFVIEDLLDDEVFQALQAEIQPDFIEPALKAGRKIKEFLNVLEKESGDFSYLLIIEGNTANNNEKSIDKDQEFGYNLSYKRALALYNLWRTNGINLKENKNVEVLLVGSGFSGLCRDKNEDNNKRFSVQIIPKVTNIKVEKN